MDKINVWLTFWLKLIFILLFVFGLAIWTFLYLSDGDFGYWGVPVLMAAALDLFSKRQILRYSYIVLKRDVSEKFDRNLYEEYLPKNKLLSDLLDWKNIVILLCFILFLLLFLELNAWRVLHLLVGGLTINAMSILGFKMGFRAVVTFDTLHEDNGYLNAPFDLFLPKKLRDVGKAYTCLIFSLLSIFQYFYISTIITGFSLEFLIITLCSYFIFFFFGLIILSNVLLYFFRNPQFLNFKFR